MFVASKSIKVSGLTKQNAPSSASLRWGLGGLSPPPPLDGWSIQAITNPKFGHNSFGSRLFLVLVLCGFYPFLSPECFSTISRQPRSPALQCDCPLPPRPPARSPANPWRQGPPYSGSGKAKLFFFKPWDGGFPVHLLGREGAQTMKLTTAETWSQHRGSPLFWGK